MFISTRFDVPSSPTPATDPRSSDEPPPDWPLDLQAAYDLAKGPLRTMANLCHFCEMDQTYLSLVEWSEWALALGNDWKKLRRWKIEHDGWLRTAPPDVLASLNAIEQVLALAVWDITSKITLLTATAIDPDDRRLIVLLGQLKAGDVKTVANLKQLRDDDAKRQRVLVDCTLEKARSAMGLLDRLKTAISLWAHQRGDFSLSQSDLLNICEAVKLLYRTIETPPTEGWEGLDWVLAANYRGVSVEMEKMAPHPYLILTAIRHVRTKLKLRSTNPENWAAEIAKSSLGDGYKKALVDLCNIMADISIDRSKFNGDFEIEAAKGHLNALRSILLALDDTEPRQPGGNGEAKGKKKVKRGAPVQSDAAADKRLCAQWRAAKSQGTTREEFARNRGIKVNDLIEAQSRERYRRRRDAE